MKRLLSILLAAALLCALLPAAFLSANAEIILPPDPFDDVVSGTCGDGVTWELNKTTGVLTISGSGAVTSAPWLSYTGSIRTLTVCEGVTAVCEGAFRFCAKLTSVSLPVTLTVIGKSAFSGCTALTDVNYAGTPGEWKNVQIGSDNEALHSAALHTAPCPHTNTHKEHEDAACLTVGFDRTLCDDCGALLSETILPALGHDLETDAAVPATCTEAGLTAGEHCRRCDYKIEQQILPALGHNWDAGVVTVEPTETEQGERTYTCLRCSATRTEIIPELSHVHSYTATVTPPTCTEQGFTTHACSCGLSYVDSYVPALGHAWDEGKVTTEPTASKDGVRTFTCTRCGETRTETIPAAGACDGGKDCPSYAFRDVRDGDWYHEAVDFAVTNKLMNGVSESRFAPNDPMTRAMLVTVLWRYEGSPEAKPSDFTDLTAGWYKDAVAWAAENGIVNGVGNGRFNPNGSITREQMATILYRYAEKKELDVNAHGDLSGFPDRGQISGYASEAIVWAVGAGLIGGANGYLMPQGNATRAQVATILMRFIENIAE